MSDVTHPTTAVRVALADVIGDQLNNGDLEYQATPGGAALATCSFQADAFPGSVDGTITASQPMGEETNASAGTVAWAQWKSSGGTVIVQCDVGIAASGADIIMSSTTLQAGDSVQTTQLVYAAPI